MPQQFPNCVKGVTTLKGYVDVITRIISTYKASAEKIVSPACRQLRQLMREPFIAITYPVINFSLMSIGIIGISNKIAVHCDIHTAVEDIGAFGAEVAENKFFIMSASDVTLNIRRVERQPYGLAQGNVRTDRVVERHRQGHNVSFDQKNKTVDAANNRAITLIKRRINRTVGFDQAKAMGQRV